MRFTKIIIKSQRKIIVVEFIIILSLLFVSSLSFYTFLSSSHTKWSDLILSSNESDLEVQATQFFETYIDLYNSYYDRFSSYEPVTITIVQSKIIQIEIDNSPVTDYNLLIVNQNLERKFNNINLSTPVLILKDGININLSVINISWNNELELKNVSLYVAPEKTENVSVLTSFFPTTKEYLFYQNLKKVNLLLTESFFFQTIKKANILSLLRVIANETSSLFSYFKFDKSEYLNYLPAKVKKAYLNYTGEIIKSFLILYNYISNNPASEILAKLKFNDIFLRKYNAFLDFFYQHLFLSLSIVFLLSVVFGAITYIYIKQSESEIRNTILFFNSRGSKSSSQESRMIFIQFMITFISFTISLTTSILLMKSLFQWDISKLVILLDNGVLSFILVILQTRLHSSIFQNIQINKKTYSEVISKSKISEIVIQIFSFIFMILGITLFWINNREFLKAGNLSAVQILLISMSLIIFLGTIIFNFQVFSFISIRIIGKVFSYFSEIHLFLLRSFIQVLKNKKRYVNIIFVIMLFSTILSSSHFSLKIHQEQLNLSTRVGALSFAVNPDDIEKVINITESNNYILSFVSTSIIEGQLIFSIEISDPMKFYENAYFISEYFQELKNREVFLKLNETSDFAITSISYAKEHYLAVEDKILVPYSQNYRDVNYKTKVLLDIAKFLPFFVSFQGNWILSKWDNSTFENLKNYIVTYVSIIDQEEGDEFITKLNELGIEYSLIHNSTITETDYNESYLINILNLPVILAEVTLAIILSLIFADIQKSNKTNFSYLNIRGLKKKKEIFNSFSWYLLTITILFSLSQLGAFFFTKIFLIILNSSYGLPFIYRNSIFALILPTILIFILTILEAIYYLSFRLKGVNHFVSKIEKRKL